MMRARAVVTNPQDIRIRVEVEMTVGEWEEVLESCALKKDAPLYGVLGLVRSAANMVRERVERIAEDQAA